MNHITQQHARPFPSLSQSSTRNYKRRGDDIYLQDNEHQLKLEQKLYGKRFKVAQQLYIRLLTTLDEMRLEAKEMASDLIADFIEEDVRLMIVKEVEEEQKEELSHLVNMVSTMASSLGSMLASPAARRAVYESIALAMIVSTYLGA